MKNFKSISLTLIIFFVTYSLGFGDLTVHFIDVGEGDCILIQMPDNKNILVDGGNLSAGYKVNQYLKSQNVSRLNCIIATHIHPDHVGGLFYILPQYKTKTIYYNGFNPQNNEFFFELIELTKALQIPLKILNAGDKLSYKQITVEVLSPLRPLSGKLNEDSIVLKVIFGKIRILLTGDLNANGEKRLIEAGYDLKSDVLKVAHHGAKDASSEEFIDKVRPRMAILSVGKNNRYGYPSQEIIERFKKRKIPLHRTDHDGTLVVHTDGEKLTFN